MRILKLVLGAVMVFAASPAGAGGGVASKDLVFVGTVSYLTQGGSDHFSRLNWVVTVNVEKVLAGDFSDRTFEFAVHSPARAGLVVGRSYTIKAQWTGSGYFVDEMQWMRPPPRKRK